MDNLDLLKIALEEIKNQNILYKATSFWATASKEITKALEEHGVDNFRNIQVALNYFVPNYGPPAIGISFQQKELIYSKLVNEYPLDHKAHTVLNHLLSGKLSALSDYRVLLSSDNIKKLPFLHLFTESNYGHPIERFDFDGKFYSRSSLNYLLGLSFLKQHLDNEIPKVILEIGGGYGTLGEIISQSGIDDWKYIDIDIPPTQFVADWYLKQVIGEDKVSGFNDFSKNNSIYIEKLKNVSVLCSWQIEQIVGNVDLFVNFISFQEMEPNVVSNYLFQIDRLNTKWVLLRNMRQGKQLHSKERDGVKTPIFTDDYPKMLPNYQLISKNVHPFGYETVDGYHSELLLFKRKYSL
jgi:putative sugar O-methyltransferase